MPIISRVISLLVLPLHRLQTKVHLLFCSCQTNTRQVVPRCKVTSAQQQPATGSMKIRRKLGLVDPCWQTRQFCVFLPRTAKNKCELQTLFSDSCDWLKALNNIACISFMYFAVVCLVWYEQKRDRGRGG